MSSFGIKLHGVTRGEITALVLFFVVFTSAGAAEKWPGTQFTEVRAYAWPHDRYTRAVILPDKSLKPGVSNPDGALLTPKQVRQTIAAVTGKYPRQPRMACYHPHNALMFFDAGKEPVAFVEICFGCLRHKTWPESEVEFPDFLSLARIFAVHRLALGEYPDFRYFKEKYDWWQNPRNFK